MGQGDAFGLQHQRATVPPAAELFEHLDVEDVPDHHPRVHFEPRHPDMPHGPAAVIDEDMNVRALRGETVRQMCPVGGLGFAQSLVRRDAARDKGFRIAA